MAPTRGSGHDRAGTQVGAESPGPALPRHPGGPEHAAAGVAAAAEVSRAPGRASRDRPRVLHALQARGDPSERESWPDDVDRRELRHPSARSAGTREESAAQDSCRAPLPRRHDAGRGEHQADPTGPGGDAHGRLGSPLAQVRLIQGLHRATPGGVHWLQVLLSQRYEERRADAHRTRSAATAAASVIPPVSVSTGLAILDSLEAAIRDWFEVL